MCTGRYSPCGGVVAKTPNCTHRCEAGYPVSYEKDKHYAANNYSIPNDVKKIQTEIMTNGPVEATMQVFGDFISYKSGIAIDWGCYNILAARLLLSNAWIFNKLAV